MEKREHHLDDAFKKDAAPEGVAVVGPGLPYMLGLRRRRRTTSAH